MSFKYVVRYMGFTQKEQKTVVFAESSKEAEFLFKKNNPRFIITSVKLDETFVKKNKLYVTINEKPFDESRIAAEYISRESAVIIPYAGPQQSIFDWFQRQYESPGCKYHFFILSDKITSRNARIIADYFVKDMRLETITAIVDGCIRDGTIYGNNNIFLYYTEVKNYEQTKK